MIGVFVVCTLTAGLMFLRMRSSGGGGIDSIPDDQMTWVKCRNSACGAEYQMPTKEYYQALQSSNPMAMSQPVLLCKECGKKSLFKAVKCENCGKVFFWRQSGANDFADRCPYCKHSAEAEKREKRKNQMSGVVDQ